MQMFQQHAKKEREKNGKKQFLGIDGILGNRKVSQNIPYCQRPCGSCDYCSIAGQGLSSEAFSSPLWSKPRKKKLSLLISFRDCSVKRKIEIEAFRPNFLILRFNLNCCLSYPVE